MQKPRFSHNAVFSIAAHLIHSRIQMLPKRLHWGGPHDIYRNNRKLLEAAARSVTADHGINVEHWDIIMAAELLYTSLEREAEYEVYVIIYTDYEKRTKTEVTSRDGGVTVVPAGKDEWFATNEEAAAIADQIRRKRPPGYHIHISIKWVMPR